MEAKRLYELRSDIDRLIEAYGDTCLTNILEIKVDSHSMRVVILMGDADPKEIEALKDQISDLEDNNRQLDRENEQLRSEIADLRAGVPQ